MSLLILPIVLVHWLGVFQLLRSKLANLRPIVVAHRVAVCAFSSSFPLRSFQMQMTTKGGESKKLDIERVFHPNFFIAPTVSSSSPTPVGAIASLMVAKLICNKSWRLLYLRSICRAQTCCTTRALIDHLSGKLGSAQWSATRT